MCAPDTFGPTFASTIVGTNSCYTDLYLYRMHDSTDQGRLPCKLYCVARPKSAFSGPEQRWRGYKELSLHPRRRKAQTTVRHHISRERCITDAGQGKCICTSLHGCYNCYWILNYAVLSNGTLEFTIPAFLSYKTIGHQWRSRNTRDLSHTSAPT